MSINKSYEEVAEWCEGERVSDRYHKGFRFDEVIADIMSEFNLSKATARLYFAKWVVELKGEIDYD